MERLEAVLLEMKEAIDNDSVFQFINLMDELEAIKGEKFMTIVVERFASTIEEGSLIHGMVMACNETEDQGGES